MPPHVKLIMATGLAITNPLVKYRALVATKAINPDPVSVLDVCARPLASLTSDSELMSECDARVNIVLRSILRSYTID